MSIEQTDVLVSKEVYTKKIMVDASLSNDEWATQVNISGNLKFGVRKNTDVDGESVICLGNAYLWVDSTGDLRVSDTYPSSDTSGTIVGTQS